MRLMRVSADEKNMDEVVLFSDSPDQIDVLTNILLCNGYESIEITPASTSEVLEYQIIKGALEWNS